MKLEKILVIAPHPDDEINLAGQMIVALNRKYADFYVLYTTNGDAEKKIGNRRIEEAVRALSLLGVDRDHVIFLGYANDWAGPQHLYNGREGQVFTSLLGKTRTNSLKEYPEFCFGRDGEHHLFTRENFKKDLGDAICQVGADVIVCVDYDGHPDHRAASLMFDEVMGELLREKPDYRPVVLKKYAYDGVWHGEKDYYDDPLPPTKNRGIRQYAGGAHELDSPNFLWKDRIAFSTPESTRTPLLTRNILYKMAKKHKCTVAWYEMQRVISGDLIYWWRPTENLIYQAEVSVSSGEKKYLSDFKLYDSRDIMRREVPVGGCEYAWRPDAQDPKKQILVRFPEKRTIRQIQFYEDCEAENHISVLTVNINGREYRLEAEACGAATKLLLPEAVTADTVQLQIEQAVGRPGITELELFETEQDFSSLDFPMERYNGPETTRTPWQKLACKVEKLWLMTHFLFAFKIQYELKNIFHR